MKVEDLEINEKLSKYLMDIGIKELFPPQAEAVEAGLMDGENFVIAIPTASGKTLIAILAIFSALLRKPGSKAVYLAPLRALASEKYQEFNDISENLGFKTGISTGDLDETTSWLSSRDIIILTNEKFDSLIRHQVSWLNEISIIVSDEVHLINDYTRGPVLEVVLSLVLRNIPDCQVIALSATIENSDEIAAWLNAELITSTWRPIELREGVWYDGEIHFSNGEIIAAGSKRDKTGYVSLAQDIVEQGGQALIFASTRKSSMKSAEDVSKKLKQILEPKSLEDLSKVADEIRSAGEKTDLREQLATLIEGGAAFHHAGLISAHRKIVEDYFRQRIIKVIASTPSLAAGVNLPGRRVIIRSLSRYSRALGNALIPVLEYKQMAGRAGRPQYDPWGQAVVIAKGEAEAEEILDRYIRSPSEDIYSQLGNERALRMHLLSFIASEYVDSVDSALEMFGDTFYGHQNEGDMDFIGNEVRKALELLINANLISKKEPYIVTPFGKKTVQLYLDPLSADKIKNGLSKSKSIEKVVDILYLQLIASTPDMRTYNVYQKDFDALYDLASEYTEEWLDNPEEYENEYSFDLFFTTLKTAKVIDMWLNEASEVEIAKKMGVTSGDLQSLLGSTNWLIHSAIQISKLFEWKTHVKALETITKRLTYGINLELLPLVDISGIGRVRARALFDAGYKSMESILHEDVQVIAKIQGFGPKLAQNLQDAIKDGGDLIIPKTKSKKNEVKQESLSSFFD
ncbi:MAG: putative ski2-type helicase [Candidatus Heimdallarchaeota archaeon LC_2]|nr:MAG: putative ski2-type helicase [Candidatus Heimdallarchaeota archaeon LC_2]